MSLADLSRERQLELAEWIGGGGYHRSAESGSVQRAPEKLEEGILEASGIDPNKSSFASQDWKHELIAILERALKKCRLQVIPMSQEQEESGR